MEEFLKSYEEEDPDYSLRVVLDYFPIPTALWFSADKIAHCNQAMLDLFELSDKQEFIDNFESLSAPVQADGNVSFMKAQDQINKTFREGYIQFEWVHQKLDGEPIPARVTLVRIRFAGKDAVAGYIEDRREIKEILRERHKAEERARIMLDATPLCANFWDEYGNNIDCNEEAVRLFGVKDKQDYLDHFTDLSPTYQPDGRLSVEIIPEVVDRAFVEGRVVFEWMHQTLSGEPVPAEVTLVRAEYDDSYIVVGYTRDLREAKNAAAQLDHLESLAFTDSGTGIYNRRYFMRCAKQAFAFGEQNTGLLAVIMIDIDWFKKVNDTFGHVAGDVVLKEIAATIQSALRAEDLLARYGGEEFIVMLHEKREGAAIRLAERIREAVSSLVVAYGDAAVNVTISLGVAMREEGDKDIDDLICRADKKLYQAKRCGRNCVVS